MPEISDYLRRVKRLVDAMQHRLRDEQRINGTFGLRRLLARRLPGTAFRRLVNPFADADALLAAGRLDEAIDFYRWRLGPIETASEGALRRQRFAYAFFADLLTVGHDPATAELIYSRILAVAPKTLPAQWGIANLRRRTATPLPPATLKIHFFTIVLNGMPFIASQIDEMLKLPFEWHWHIVEGVASLSHDTAWSAAHGGRVDASFHRNGLSNDGTSEYLDTLAREHPERVTIYRKPAGAFWDGKIEMVRAPLARIGEECLLWEIDVDEFWTADMFARLREMFRLDPNRTAAYFVCHFFFKSLVVTSANTYGNHLAYEWLRVWRFRPGDQWLSHEPPRLGRQSGDGDGWDDLGALNPFTHGETLRNDLIFRHYAYVLPAQLRFKEVYYGYRNALKEWEDLPATGPVRLRDHLSWIDDDTRADDSRRHGIAPPTLSSDGSLTAVAPGASTGSLYRAARSSVSLSRCTNILVAKLDNLGDVVLLSPFLRALRRNAPRAKITLLVRQPADELMALCPYVDHVVPISLRGENGKFDSADTKFLAAYRSNAFDLAIVPRWDIDEFCAGVIARNSGARHVIGFGEGTNQRKAVANRGFDNSYTEVLAKISSEHEVIQNLALLRFMNGTVESDHLEAWYSRDDEARADALLKPLGDGPIIAICPGASHSGKMLPTSTLAEILTTALAVQRLVVLGSAADAKRLAPLHATFGGRILSLCGQTTLRETSAILRRCRAAIAMDAGPAHFAAAVGTPVVVFSMHPRDGDDTQDPAPARFAPWCPDDRKLIIQPDHAWPGCETGCRWRYVQPHCIGNIDPAKASAQIRAFIGR
ncbi:MAG TPA: glycosyltransferase family 9 protein [Stellaceae bacterium]|nr:glycosyltransferase family 9 protein [Stellaceae bacterium]